MAVVQRVTRTVFIAEIAELVVCDVFVLFSISRILDTDWRNRVSSIPLKELSLVIATLVWCRGDVSSSFLLSVIEVLWSWFAFNLGRGNVIYLSLSLWTSLKIEDMNPVMGTALRVCVKLLSFSSQKRQIQLRVTATNRIMVTVRHVRPSIAVPEEKRILGGISGIFIFCLKSG